MNRFITLRTGIIALVVITTVAVGLSLWNISNQQDKYAITEEVVTPEEKVSVDFSQYRDVFTPAQQAEIQANLLTRSTKERSGDSEAKGVIRESSFVRPSEYEVLLVIDSAELQTSYLISRFVNPGENLDILNITCVDESQRIYEQDYCRAE